MKIKYLLSLLLFSFQTINFAQNQKKTTVKNQKSSLRIVKDSKTETLSVFRQNGKVSLLSQVVKSNFRPYLHPITSPDGKSILTEYSPGHHKHQTGIYWGYTRVNGRDYFHHPEGDYWRKVTDKIIKTSGLEVK